jgi:hypothetical protein
MIGIIVMLAMANEGANGANFSLVPHCNPCEYSLHYKYIFDLQSLKGSNGFMVRSSVIRPGVSDSHSEHSAAL